MKLVVLGTGIWTEAVIKSVKAHAGIDLVGLVSDISADEDENRSFSDRLGGDVKILPFEMSSFEEADLIFTCECRRKIDNEYINNFTFVNCHGGILPRYRGISSNSWAIINGAKEIGYTIHKMDEKFDNGGIYYIGRFRITQEQTYSDLYNDIYNDMVQKIAGILLKIYDKKLMPVKQEGLVQYNSKLYREFGDLKDFNSPSSYITNLYRAMSRPHGTGVYFMLNGKKIYTDKIIDGNNVGVVDYFGMHGRIVNIADGYIWVKTKDNVVLLSKLYDEFNNVVATDNFRIGNWLGR